MPPQEYDPVKVAAAKKRLAAAKNKREKDLKEATDRINTAFWRTVRDELAAKNLRQADAVDALGFSREHIRQQLANLTD